jgi:hypothetical protein
MAFFIFSVRDICVTGQYSLTFYFFFFSVAAIAELLDNAVDEVCSIF